MSSLERSPERSLLRDGVAAVLLFLLLLEWLRPLLDMAEWSGVYRISPFMVAFGLFVAVDWLKLSPWLGWPVKIILCIGLVGYLFGSAPSFWLLRYAELTMKDFVALADQDYGAISPDNRTMLFLIGWSMMITVIYASVVERKHALWFVAVTLLYLLGLQLWPGVNTSTAIIRTVWFGFLLIGLQQFSRLESRFALKRHGPGWPVAWIVAVPLLLTAAVAAGLWFPPAAGTGAMQPLDAGKLADRLVSWGIGGADSASGRLGAGAGGVARTGYGGDDTLLGGPLRPDDSVAFTAMTERLTYWRGEAKTFYTGKGWESGGSVDDSAGAPHAPERTIVQEVTIVDPSLAGRLFAGGRIEKVEEMVTRSGNALVPEDSLVNVFGTYLLAEPNAKDPLQRYILKVKVPDAVPEGQASPSGGSGETASDANASEAKASDTGTGAVLAEGSEAASEANAPEVKASDAGMGAVPAEGGEAALSGSPVSVGSSTSTDTTFAAGLQLPASLPIRVKLLAETVSMSGSDAYSRAKAIETFLKTNYRYRLDVPAVPKSADDFADAFLFESKEGYCDYFSTSMVVMLRSIGIPARWVKGFSPGDVTDRGGTGGGDGAMMQVTVRNSDAHSWVEAYIPGSGWATFDPTPGNELAAFAASEPAQAVFAAAPAADEPVAETGENGLTRTMAFLAQMVRDRLSSAWSGGGARELLAAYGLPLAAALLALPLLLWGLHQLARKPRLAGRSAFTRGYAGGRRASAYRPLDRLWRALFRKLGGKKPGLTVREYVEGLPLDEGGKREALLGFVKQYEAVRYGGVPLPRSAKRDMKELWRRIKS